MIVINFHIEDLNYQPCVSNENSISNLVSGVAKEDAFIRLWCEFVEVVCVVDYETSTPKYMKELDIWIAVVKALIWCFVETFAHNASILYKTSCRHCFGPEVERKVCKIEHRSGSFY